MTRIANGETRIAVSIIDAVPTGLMPRKLSPPASHTSAMPIAICAAGPSGRMNER